MAVCAAVDALSKVATVARFFTNTLEFLDDAATVDRTSTTQKIDLIVQGLILGVEGSNSLVSSSDARVYLSLLGGNLHIGRIYSSTFSDEARKRTTITRIYCRLIGHITGALRNFNDAEVAHSERRMAMSDEEFSKEVDYIADPTSSHDEIKHIAVPATRERCIEILERNAEMQKMTSFLEVLCKAPYLRVFDRPPIIADILVRFDLPADRPEGMFDFLSFDRIPEELQDDAVLSGFTDPISLRPIRFAATHRRHPQVIYEKKSIQDYINLCIEQGREPRCPLTRDLITHDDVIDAVNTQGVIDRRLTLLKNRLTAQFRAQIIQANAQIGANDV